MSDAADFVGTGWAFPPRVDARGRIALASGFEEIEGAMRMILLTALGERVMRPEFGCRVWDYLFEPINPTTMGLVESSVRDALERWEPRVRIEAVKAAEDPDRMGGIIADVTYVTRDTNDRRNLVVPFYEIGEEA
ncbi:MAG: GPW/gp25 family protein [Dehalococcoidia bacterium]|nr:GPW/gp25 family protein [Dehalococcoidia bacterium]